jgi:hypothetical protein
MKQNLRDKAFVAFVCLVGKPLLPKIVVGNHRPKKSSQDAMTLHYSSTDSTDFGWQSLWLVPAAASRAKVPLESISIL